MNTPHQNTPLLQVAAWPLALLLMASCAGSPVDRHERVLQDGKELQVDLGGGAVMEFVRIEPGTFLMGSPPGQEGRNDDEGPQTQVTITRPFFLGKYEVTQAEWEAVMGSNPSYYSKGGKYPVEDVSWEDCQEFIQRLNARCPGRRFRLPTEAEWEYACRAGTTGVRYGELNDVAWTKRRGDWTHPVGQKKANAWGLHDMLGNVWEWCADWYGNKYPGGSVTDPVGPANSSARVVRGGSSLHSAECCRATYRFANVPAGPDCSLGLRLATSAP